MVHDEKKLQDLLRKIRALKAKAEDDSTTEAESMTFTAKVQELMAQYGLEESQLKVEDQEQLGHEETLEKLWNASLARRVLVHAVCKLYFVHTLRYNYGVKKGTWVLIGRKHNLIMAKEMSEYLIKTVLRLGREYARSNPLGNDVDFKRGCFMRVAERLDEMRRQQAEASAPQWRGAGNPGNLPALYRNERALADAYVARVYGSTTHGRATRVRQGYDAIAGRAAGDRVSLNRQVGGGTSHYMIGKK